MSENKVLLVGDRVSLRGVYGPGMVVVLPDANRPRCGWFDYDNRWNEAEFDRRLLEPEKGESPPEDK